MRVTLIAWLFVAMLQLSAQQTGGTDSVASILGRMKGEKWVQRQNAFGRATDLLSASQTSPADADRLRLGIIQLLERENSGGLKEPDDVPPANYTEGYGEDKSEYYASLIGFVGYMDDERAIPALLGAATTGEMATRAVARFGKHALNPTLTQARGRDPHLAAGALSVVRDMLEFGLVTDQESLFQIKKALVSALRSPEFEVRLGAMSAIEYMDDRDEFVPMLKEIAEHDPVRLPGRPDDGGDNGKFYPARLHARRLLEKIAGHQRPAVDSGLPSSEYQPIKP